MSETISNLPTTAARLVLGDGVPVTSGYRGPSTGITFVFTCGDVLSANGLIYAGDPQYGVKADGITDDTNAWGNALGAAFSLGTWVVAPIGSVSLVSAINVPSGVGIIGRSTQSYSASLGPETIGSVIKCTSATAPGITLNAFSQLQSIQVQGSGSQPCIQTAAGFYDIVDVTCFNGSSGISSALSGGASRISRCRIHDCASTGILAGLDLTIDNTVITSSGDGIRLSNGCNAVRIIGGRIEKGTGYGVIADGTGGTIRDLVIDGVSFDANGKASVALKLVNAAAVHGCIFSRSGQSQGSTPGANDDCHVALTSCNAVSVSGNSSRTGLNDQGGGYNSPFYAIVDGAGNTNSLIAANALAFHNNASSSTSGPINVTTTFNLAASLNQSFWS